MKFLLKKLYKRQEELQIIVRDRLTLERCRTEEPGVTRMAEL